MRFRDTEKIGSASINTALRRMAKADRHLSQQINVVAKKYYISAGIGPNDVEYRQYLRDRQVDRVTDFGLEALAFNPSNSIYIHFVSSVE